MIRKSHLFVSLMLVFAIAFSLSLVTYTPTKALDCPPPPLQGCCVIMEECNGEYICGYGVPVPGVGCVEDRTGTSGCPRPPDCPIP